MQAYRPRNRPADLTLSPAKKALRSDAKDPFLFCPSRTPTSARFSQSEFSLDAFDLEVRRNTVDLQTGAIFNNDIVIETDSLDTSYNSSIYDLYSSKGVVYGLPSPPTSATPRSELHQQFADAHSGAYPRVGLFTEQSEVKDDGAFNMKNEDSFTFVFFVEHWHFTISDATDRSIGTVIAATGSTLPCWPLKRKKSHW